MSSSNMEVAVRFMTSWKHTGKLSPASNIKFVPLSLVNKLEKKFLVARFFDYHSIA